MSSLPKAIFKSILVVLGIGAVVIVLLGVGGYLWFRQTREELLEMGREARAEGRAYGRGRSKDECAPEALRRIDRAEGIVEEVAQNVFLQSCLRAAKATPTFCNGVPPRSEVMQSVSWTTGYCARAGRSDDQACARLARSIQDYCHRRSR